MKRYLKSYVKNKLFASEKPPPTTNRRYYPTDMDIRNCMYRASVKFILSKIDQESIEKNIDV
jgi:hedgehog interacting protein